MGTTTNGLPYPEPTDPVAQGADAIKALAQALDPRVDAGKFYNGTCPGATLGPNGTQSQVAAIAGPVPVGVYLVSYIANVSCGVPLLGGFRLFKAGGLEMDYSFPSASSSGSFGWVVAVQMTVAGGFAINAINNAAQSLNVWGDANYHRFSAVRLAT